VQPVNQRLLFQINEEGLLLSKIKSEHKRKSFVQLNPRKTLNSIDISRYKKQDLDKVLLDQK
jgi:hypothetical protein